MIGWPDYPEERPSYQFVELPKPAGYWILYAEGPADIRFTMLYKPSWIQRWFTSKLLGWTWEDAE
jgi:hypothetical protein